MRTWNSVSSPQLHPLYDLFCRDVLELKEAIRIKEAEGDAYISEIEVSSFLVFLSAVFLFVFVCECVWKQMMLSLQTIGQAYEDMQTQNQHLLQQVADRDDFNIKVRIWYQGSSSLPACWALCGGIRASISPVFPLCWRHGTPLNIATHH